MILPQRLSELRHGRNLTQHELARLLPINRGTYAHYELGKRQPDLETLIRIADFYKVSTDYLLGQTDIAATVNAIYRFYTSKTTEYAASPERGSEQVAEGPAACDDKPGGEGANRPCGEGANRPG